MTLLLPWSSWLPISSLFKTSSETKERLAGARGNKSGKEMKRRRFTSTAEKAFSAVLVNLRRFISLPDLFLLALANRPLVSEDVFKKGNVLSVVEVVLA